MVNSIVNVLIAAVIGAVAYIAVRALIIGSSVIPCGTALACDGTTGNITGVCGRVFCVNGTEGTMCNGTYSGANQSWIASTSECWTGAECTLMVTIIPLTVAIVTVVLLFLGLTKIRGA